ncbi:MAG: VWA domain-containing protein [Acidobacteriota bacterium]|nr:VWA domain-containing protein [Acidobacteriota bacterium]
MNQIELLRPDLLILGLVPVLLLLLRWRFWRNTVEHPQTDRFPSLGLQKPPRWLYLPRVLDWMILVLLVGVFIEPVLPVGQRQTTVRALDLILCLDLSASMRKGIEEEPGSLYVLPGEVSRLDAVKEVALDFIASRPQDRIGLVVFSANAYLVNPLTTDHDVLTEYIELLDGNTLIGEGLTSVGEGLQVSNELFSFFEVDDQREGKAIIVFTDAEQNYGRKPDGPLQVARQNNTRVFFVGVGIPVEVVLGSLTSVVEATGGGNFDAMNAGDLERVSQQIDRLQRNSVEITEYFRNQALAWPLLGLAFVLLVGNCALRALPLFYVTG